MKLGLSISIALLAATAATLPALGQTVLPPDAVVLGKNVNEWTKDYWRWVVKNPIEEFPLDDTDGAFATRLNDGPVFFVAYTNNGIGPV